MTQFEYVAVAIALLYSLAMARLVSGLPHTTLRLTGDRIVLAWTLALILQVLLQWWIFWRFREVTWTPLRFAWILGSPAILYMQSSLLLTESPREVPSWEAHFEAVRRRVFALALVVALHTALMPWILGSYPWFTFAPAHAFALITACGASAALASASQRLHLGLACAFLVLLVVGLFLTPDS